MSSNGIANFSGPNLQYANGCLPARVEGRAVIVLWDDMDTRPSGRGVFTSTVGSAPNRQFIIRFNMAYLSGGGSANAEVDFHRGSDNFQVIYGTATQGGSSSTEGVQAAGSGPNFTQFGCNQVVLTPGLLLNYTYSGPGDHRHHRHHPGAAATSAATASTASTSAAAAATSASATTAAPAARCRVPRVIGLPLVGRGYASAERGARSARISRVRSRRVGRVIRQSPRPGAVRRRGFPVRLVVGRR